MNTLLTRLARPDIASSFFENKKDDGRHRPWRYADNYAAISPICEDFLAQVGITSTSAYSWLCRRRHNHDLRHTHATLALKAGVPVKVIRERLGHESPAFTLKQ